MKKRMIAALMATALTVSALAGCSSKPAESAAAPAETTAAATEAATEAAKESAGTEAATEAAAPAGEGSDYHLAICIHSMDNEYWAQEAEGARLAAASYGVSADVLTCDSDDNKQLQGIKDYIAQYGDKAVFVVDPSSTANTANIAELCEESGNYVAILAHRADGLYPKDYPHFVASLMLDDIAIGKATAKALFESIGGEGQVAELQGLLGDDSATNRTKHLRKP